LALEPLDGDVRLRAVLLAKRLIRQVSSPVEHRARVSRSIQPWAGAPVPVGGCF